MLIATRDDFESIAIGLENMGLNNNAHQEDDRCGRRGHAVGCGAAPAAQALLLRQGPGGD
jgi:hypothetical protein